MKYTKNNSENNTRYQTVRNSFIASIIVMVAAQVSFGQTAEMKASLERGQSVYESRCSSCHMAEGEGIESVFPPLANTKNLTDKNRLVKIVLLGMRGPITVNGVAYDGEKAGFELTDQEVADVVNYIRNSWGNKGPLVRPEEVQPALKAKTKDYQPY
jgi:mono/diheme cytochrome c family protein